MTTALLWKEYRQQRAVWLAVTILAVLLVLSFVETLGHGSGWQELENRSLRFICNGIIITLAITFGLVSGTLLLAAERDDGTLTFLDCQVGLRGPVWSNKVAAGVVLTLSQSIALAVFAIVMGFGSWSMLLTLPTLGLHALAWGLLGGALCSTVVVAILTSIVLMAASWLLSLISENVVALVLLEAVPTILAAAASRLVFCRQDFTRDRGILQNELITSRPAFSNQWRVLLWLTLRQGRWLILGCILGIAMLAYVGHQKPLVYWPIGTLLLGAACGLAAFAPDQQERSRFLGSQRFPPGRMWTVKIVVWSAAALVFTTLMWLFFATEGWPGYVIDLVKNVGVQTREPPRSLHPLNVWMEGNFTGGTSNALLLLAIWPLYGFCFGQFFGQVARRPVIATILAVFVSPLIAVLWVPSLLVGSVPYFLPLIVPAILLVTTRCTQRAWLTGRLYDLRSLLGLGSAAILMVIAVAGSLYYRAIEVPNVGEPFDVKAFVASLPTPDKNEAGQLIRQAAVAMAESRRKAEVRFGPLPGNPFEPPRRLKAIGDLFDPTVDVDPDVAPLPNRGLDPKMLLQLKKQQEAAEAVFSEKRKQQIDNWWVNFFEDAWVNDAAKAARHPLGMVEDPRHVTQSVLQNASRGEFEELGRMITLRALLRQFRGDASGALSDLETALGLSRQLRNFAVNPRLQAALNVEKSALDALHIWLENLGPDKELIQAAQLVLRKHEAAIPDPINSTKADYLALRNEYRGLGTGGTLAQQLANIALEVPWEKERQRRINYAIAFGAVRSMQEPGLLGPEKQLVHRVGAGLPPPKGPGSELTVAQWKEIVQVPSAGGWWWTLSLPQSLAAASLTRVRANELIMALSHYQADNAKLPQHLKDLIPKYVDKLPSDPSSGRSFGYIYIPNGPPRNPGQFFPPQQARIFSESNPGMQIEGPLWPKKQEKHP